METHYNATPNRALCGAWIQGQPTVQSDQVATCHDCQAWSGMLDADEDK